MSQSVARALHLLIQLGSGPASLDELAESTGVHKTTVHRSLAALRHRDYVAQDPASGRYGTTNG